MKVMSNSEFNKAFDTVSPMLHSFAINLTRNEDNAKDLFQETAFRAITNKDKFKPGTNLKAWLFTIMKNIFINNYRKRKKSATIFDSTDNQFFLNSGSVMINNDAESNILIKELNKMINELDEGVRVPFEMHNEGFKYQEISECLDLPLGTVKSRIFFARKELKDKIYAKYGKDIISEKMKQAG